MKIQAILFTLLHAQTVLSAENEGERASVGAPVLPDDFKVFEEDDCASRCKTQLRMSPSKMKQCFETNCGAKNEEGFGEEEGADNGRDFPENHGACVSRCKRLRFGPAKQEECIEECGREDSSSDKSGFDSEAKGGDDRDFPGNDTACVARCKRLRFGPTKREECIEACGSDDNSREVSSLDEEGEEMNDSDFPGNDTACVARCKRLRFGPTKREGCIADCGADDGSRKTPRNGSRRSSRTKRSQKRAQKKSNFHTKKDESDKRDFPGNSNACVARCKRLRFSHAKQEECIQECGQYNASNGGEVYVTTS